MTEKEEDIGSYLACNCGFFHFIEALESVEENEERKKELLEMFLDTSLKLYKYAKLKMVDFRDEMSEKISKIIHKKVV